MSIVTNRRLFDGAQTEIGSVKLGSASDTAPAKPILELTAWRFYDDNAAMGVATALGTENVAYSRDLNPWVDKQYQLHVQLVNRDASVNVTSPKLTLQRRYNGGAWEPITDTTSVVQWAISPYMSVGEGVTARLTAPGGTTYIAGVGVEGTGSYQSSLTMLPARHTEIVWIIKQVTSEIAAGDVIDLRIVRDDTAEYMTFTRQATMQIVLTGVTGTIATSWGGWSATAIAKVDKNLITVTGVQWCKDDGNPDVSSFTGDSDGRVVVPLGTTQWQIRWQWRHDGPGFQDASTFYLQFRSFSGVGLSTVSPWYDLNTSWGVTMATSPNYSNNFFMGNVPARMGSINPAEYTGSGRGASNTAQTTGNLPQGKYNEYCWCLKTTNSAPHNVEGVYFEFRIRRDLEYDYIDYGGFTPKLVLGTWNAPVNVVAAATGQTTVRLTWNAVTAARGYDIERNGVTIATDWPASPYDDSGLVANTGYNYRVTAVG